MSQSHIFGDIIRDEISADEKSVLFFVYHLENPKQSRVAGVNVYV